MAFDREEFEGRKKERKKEKVVERRGELGAMQREALAADYVTGDEHWDMFLSILQAKINKLRGQVDVAREHLEKSNDFSPEVLINQKLAVRGSMHEIETLEWVIELPKTLKEQGDKASELLETVDKTPD